MRRLPPDLLSQAAMLAAPSKTIDRDVHRALSRLHGTGRYYFDLKWDGVRCLAYAAGGKVWLRNRRGIDITARYPEVVAALAAAYPEDAVVLDGELVCFDATTGDPRFSLIHRRDAYTTPPRGLVQSSPASFIAFDALWHERDLRREPLNERLAILAGLSARWPENGTLRPSIGTTEPGLLWQTVQDRRLEGLIAKTLTGRYVGKRDAGWLKLKPVRRLSAVVTGYDPGEGQRRQTFGALHVAVVDAAKRTYVPVGKVGSGFTQSDLMGLLPVVAAGGVLIVDVEYQEVSENGQLRFPVYKGVRGDLELLDCGIDQLS